MHVCEKCGHESGGEDKKPESFMAVEVGSEDGLDDEAKMKDSALAELMDLIEEKLAPSFAKKEEEEV